MQNIIITGGHSGIGLELTKRLVADGERVGLIVRSRERAAGIKGVSDLFEADLSDQTQVRTVAQRISEQWGNVDVLVNNAGVLLDGIYQSPQNNEMHYEVNTLAPYLLTTQLESALTAAAAPVVVNTVADNLHKAKALDVDELLAPTQFRKLFGSYMQSKLAVTLLMNDLATAWPSVRIVNVTPGPNKTDMTGSSGMPAWLKPLRSLFFAAPAKGAGRLYDAAIDSGGLSGTFIQNGRAHTLSLALSPEQKARLLAGIIEKHPT